VTGIGPGGIGPGGAGAADPGVGAGGGWAAGCSKVHSWPHVAQRSLRPALTNRSGISYTASQDGQVARMAAGLW
jgi:hypothetical protein